MGRGNGQRAERVYHIGFYHDGYVYLIKDEYGPVVRVKANSAAEFQNFAAEWKAWVAGGHAEELSDKHYVALTKMFSGYSAFRNSEKEYDFQAEKRRLENEELYSSPSLMGGPSHRDYHPARISRVYIEKGNVVTYWDGGDRMSLPL
jgi:hypothetical protein